MPLATINDVRQLGRLPDSSKLPDEYIQPHLDAAERELTRWIGNYSDAGGDKLNACIEAECCICIAYLLPVLNTFYTQGITSLQKELGEMDFLFHSPSDLEKLQNQWLERARNRVADYITSNKEKPVIGWYAI